ncbi:ABC transporter permease [Mycetocola tolaasinivorans]|uniref:ABC transporter permease n=1 Tax=Mycetocola tolaasinivorans TaxID=76635 RepID=A0A3L7A8J1_9MICO|nr:ABC transporter permease [Mycetocola tolaasinivorans]RLP76487.1 ABC transporter permease [Mycetocola tolaasinivorans]
MAAQLLRLRLHTILNALRGDPRAVARRVLLVCVLAVACALVAWAAFGNGTADPLLVRGVVGAGGALILLGCFLVPLVSTPESTLDPRTYAGFGIAPWPLAGALALASLLGLPALALLILGGIVSFGLAGETGGGTAAAVLGTVLVPITGVLQVRLGRALGAGLGDSSRRALRTLTGAILGAGTLAIVCLELLAPARLETIADVAAWTPLGAAWLLADPAPAVPFGARLAITLASIVILAAAWGVACVRLTSSIGRPEHAGGLRLGWFARVPAGATAAVAARSLTYWIRDPRYLTSLLIVPVVPIVAVSALSIAGVSWSVLSLLPLPIILLFVAWAPHNDLALDSSALWLHITSGVSGLADRVGRILPVLALGVILIAIGAPLSVSLGGVPEMLPALIGVAGGLLLTGLGLASYFSARTPYPAVQPGDSPFLQPQAGGGYSARVQSVSLIGTLVLSAPAITLGVLAALGSSQAALWALAAGLGVGVIVLILGILAGARYYDRHTAELMEFATTH